MDTGLLDALHDGTVGPFWQLPSASPRSASVSGVERRTAAGTGERFSF
jgi:hypothetical protein